MKVAASSSGDMETNEAYAIRARGLNGSKFGSRQGRKIRGCSKASGRQGRSLENFYIK